MTKSEEILLQRLSTLSPEDPRAQVIDAALSFKASWHLLAERLTDLSQSKLYLQWGYQSLEAYCQSELRLQSATYKKLIRSYNWLHHESQSQFATQLRHVIQDDHNKTQTSAIVPETRSIDVMMRAERALHKNQIHAHYFKALDDAAIEGIGHKQLHEKLQSYLKPEQHESSSQKIKLIRRSIRHCIEVINALSILQADDHFIEQAECIQIHLDSLLQKQEKSHNGVSVSESLSRSI